MDTVSQAPLILITGGGRGVGAATARLAAEQGYDVAISFVSNESAAPAVAADVKALGRQALLMRADSADPEQVAQLFAAIDRTFGRIDVLVNNADNNCAAIPARGSRIRKDAAYLRGQLDRSYPLRKAGGEADVLASQRTGRLRDQHLVGICPTRQSERICRLRCVEGRRRDVHYRICKRSRT